MGINQNEHLSLYLDQVYALAVRAANINVEARVRFPGGGNFDLKNGFSKPS